MKLCGVLSHFRPVRVLVIGDFMLDTYTTGKIKRISPEAPVSVLHVRHEESQPGGAGNVVLNLLSLGAEVIAVGRIGSDRAGEHLQRILQKEGADTTHLVVQEGYNTPVKNRLIAESQQVLRVDFETITAPSLDIEHTILSQLASALEHVDIVAISDYGKGFLSHKLLQGTIALAKKNDCPVIVDPKGEDFIKYAHATVIKPNLTEAYAAAKLPFDVSLDHVAATLLSSCQVEKLLVTRSEAGMSLFDKEGERFDFPVHSKEVKDVTGAGDTVLAMISVALANDLDLTVGARLANIAAGIAIERLGCARVTLSDMAQRLLESDAENKVFDEEHLFALQRVLSGKRYVVLGIHSHQGMSTALFRTLKKLSVGDEKLIVYIRDNDPDAEFVSLLSSLSEVDFIVLQGNSLKNLSDNIHPLHVYVMEGTELVALEHPDLLLKS